MPKRHPVEAREKMTATPKVVLGVPLYNGAEHLAEALESLLTQTYSDFKMVVVDDCSTDRTEELARAYAKEDPRIHFSRNDRRLGHIGNARRTFELANDLRPDLDYFAWGSDNDVWQPRWLESLVPELDAHPEAVLAYPRTATISRSGERAASRLEAFDTAEVDDPRRRAELTWHAGGFGSRAAGLFRAHALARCGVCRYVFIPDRLLLVELALQGRFREVPEVLWYRRLPGMATFERQRDASFPDRRAPLQFRRQWVYPHSAILFWALAVRGHARPAVTRREGAAFAARYLALGRERVRGKEHELREKLAETRKQLSLARQQRAQALQRANEHRERLQERRKRMNELQHMGRKFAKMEKELLRANEQRDRALQRADELRQKLQETRKRMKERAGKDPGQDGEAAVAGKHTTGQGVEKGSRRHHDSELER